MDYWTISLSIVIGAVGIYYLFKEFNYFKRHNIIHMPPVPIFGSMLPLVLRRLSIAEFAENLYYFNPDAKYIGLYAATQPIIFIRDPELIKETFIKNFDNFPNRIGFGYINDPLFSKNLFSLQGQKWKDVRTMLSPAFTTSKMKTMFTLMLECAVDFAKYLSEISTDKNDMDMKDAYTKYANDVIATCAFGIKINSLRDPTNDFYVFGKEATNFQGFLSSIKFFLFGNFPKLVKILGLKFIRDDVGNFFRNVIKSTIDTRDTENITRPDMIQLMMDIRGKREAEKELTIEEMTAQAFVFFLAGFETTSTAMSFITQVILDKPDVQAKLRQEIDNVLENSNGEVTYEAINHLEYLDAVISEILRLYPPIAVLERLCEKDYELPPALPNKKPLTLKKGQVVWAPVYSIQHDEKYFDDPEEFRPERFLGNNTYHNSPYYAPFGLGPRMCIANRFALLEIKVLLFHLLARCELKPCTKTVLPIKFSKAVVMAVKGGFWLNVQRRHDIHPTIRSTTLKNDVTNI
ncbi:PREDICTED: cytochrome P450 9e2-like [Dinoponera quadriceps]|uniref:Cytochrome P450 9e2-like n=1 Tax=Dinoponera quadriceps TaxID=609295 RepID=A0A6P3XG01_DINQU|nr:PREDICTED: cytochrome P450 9e2-like [Dinoponera quadriceps]